ncbi:MAG: TetR/AcrR family transcriptional regulator [Treponema sp.]|jgi:TetR/AcrR family transcriptional regulator|nr:TetR/AcrR family transcriptional regulator [Treponema sp.]
MDKVPETKERLLTTALSIFSRRGYETSSIQEIVNEVGISKPTLYYYFGNKQGLLEAIASEYGTPLLELTTKTAKYEHNLVMNLTGLFREILSFALRQREFFRLFTSLFSAAPETSAYTVGNGMRRRLTAILEKLFEEASQDHGNMRNRQQMYAESFFGQIQTWALLAINDEINLTEELQFKIIHQYMHGIFS